MKITFDVKKNNWKNWHFNVLSTWVWSINTQLIQLERLNCKTSECIERVCSDAKGIFWYAY